MLGVSRTVGSHYERLAERLLEGLGFRTLARNFTCKGGEIDLVCQDGEVLVFVEVRGRASTSHGHPEETVDRWKQRRIVRAAITYLLRNGLGEPTCRFDVIGIDETGARLHRDAFRVE
jgi:putative endonuclease